METSEVEGFELESFGERTAFAERKPAVLVFTMKSSWFLNAFITAPDN